MEKRYRERLAEFLKDATAGKITPELGKLGAAELLRRMDKTGILHYQALEVIPEGRVADWKRGKGKITDEILLALRRALRADPSVETDDPLLEPLQVMCNRWEAAFKPGKYEGEVGSFGSQGELLVKGFLDGYHPDPFIGAFEYVEELTKNSKMAPVWLPHNLASFGKHRGYTSVYIDELINQFVESDNPTLKEETLSKVISLYCFPKPEEDRAPFDQINQALGGSDTHLIVKTTLDIIDWLPLLDSPWDQSQLDAVEAFKEGVFLNLTRDGVVAEMAALAIAHMTRAGSLRHTSAVISEVQEPLLYEVLKSGKASPLAVKWLALVAGKANAHQASVRDYLMDWAKVADGAKERKEIEPHFSFPVEEVPENLQSFIRLYEEAGTDEERRGLSVMLRRVGYRDASFFEEFKKLVVDKKSGYYLKSEVLAYLAYDNGEWARDFFKEELLLPDKKRQGLFKDWAFLALVGTADLDTLADLFETSIQDPTLDSKAIFCGAVTGFTFGQGRLLMGISWWKTSRGRRTMWKCLSKDMIQFSR